MVVRFLQPGRIAAQRHVPSTYTTRDLSLCPDNYLISKSIELTVNLAFIISSTRSCQVRCVSLDVATILRIVTPHDREGPEAWPYARHERDILAREDKKD